MRGETCIRGATVLSFVALVLLIFLHIGQINASTLPREIALLRVNISAYGTGLQSATGDPSPGLYDTNNSSAPLGKQNGLRQIYAWGLYSYCAYTNGSSGTCSNTSFAQQFAPFDAMLADTPGNYTVVTRFLISKPNTTFSNTSFLQTSSRAAFYLIFIGSICTALAMFCGIPKSSLMFVFASLFAALGAVLLLVGAVIWTTLIHKIRAINNLDVDAGAPLGIEVSYDKGLWLLWSAFAILTVSLLPYFVSCHTYRSRY